MHWPRCPLSSTAARAWACCWVGALVALAWLVGPALAQDLQAVPPLDARVVDRTATLSGEQKSALETKLAAFERETGSQLAVLIVPSTAPEDIAAYAQRVGEAWKLGRREVGDGLLIVVAKDERKLRIEVAKALEGAVPDLAGRQIIERALTPAFRANDYAGGLNAAIDQLSARIRGENLPLPSAPGQGSTGGAQWSDLALFFLLGVPVVGALLTGVLGRKLGTLATSAGAGGLAWLASASLLVAGGAAVVALVLVGVLGLGAMRRGGGVGGFPPVIWGGGGWGGGGGGGGGFSSGGGGDFGGGGASGGW